jgi:anti-anti-sigma factor
MSAFSPAQLSMDTCLSSPGTVRVAVSGEIDLSTADVFRAGLLNVVSAQLPERIEVDLAGVTFLDCSALTVLVVVAKAAARGGWQLRITNPQPVVRRILALTGLLDVLAAPFDPTSSAAARSTSAAAIGFITGRMTRLADVFLVARHP